MTMQAIRTKYHGPTNYRGSRYSASAERGRISVPCDHSKNVDENHKAAALALVHRFADEDAKKYATKKDLNPWLRPFVSGTLPDGSQAHVFTE